MESSANCPYSKIKNNISKVSSFFGRDREEDTLIKLDTEKGLSSERIELSSGCPYKEKQAKETNSKVEASKSDDDEEENQGGGCPAMGKKRKDPENKHYTPTYEINRFGKFDFLFMMTGGLDNEDYLEQSKNIRAMPHHLKYTLFHQAQEKLQQVHEKEFPVVFFLYDDIKEKGNRHFQKKKFREAIEHYIYAYGLLKWIQFKDKKRQEEFLKRPSLEPILDQDIEEKHVYLDDVKVEEDSYKACLVYLLMNLAAAYMELRHYKEALECLDEAIPIADDKVPDLFFRRSQVRTYNRSQNESEFELAMQDIEHAIKLKQDKFYSEHKDILISIMDERRKLRDENVDRIYSKVKRSYQRIKDSKVGNENVIYTKKGKDAYTQYKILKEMKSKYALAIKFFTESKNEEQLELCYKEIEKFMATFEKFKFFLKFRLSDISTDNLSEEEKALLDDNTMIRLCDEFKFKICEDDIFGVGDFNFELFHHALEKVMEEERKVEEEEEKRLEIENPKLSWYQTISKSNFLKYFSGGVILLSVGTLGAHYYLYSASAFSSLFP